MCLGWPVGSFPGGKVGLQKGAQNNLRVKSGDEVMLHPITGPVLQAEEVLLTNRYMLHTCILKYHIHTILYIIIHYIYYTVSDVLCGAVELCRGHYMHLSHF